MLSVEPAGGSAALQSMREQKAIYSCVTTYTDITFGFEHYAIAWFNIWNVTQRCCYPPYPEAPFHFTVILFVM